MTLGEIVKRLLIIPPIVAGVFIFMFMTREGEEGEPVAPPEIPVAVRILDVAPQSYSMSASGFGRVEAVNTWSAVSQVEGRVIQLAPEVSVGSIISAGKVFAQTDGRDYEIALAKAQAARDSAQASLEELAVNEKNYRERLSVEEEILENLRAERERQERLVASGNTARANLDAANRSALSQQKTVIDLQATLALVPAQKTSQEASLASAEADIEQAQRDLAATVYKAPFTGRVVSKSVSDGQYVRVGDTLVTLEAVDASEVEALFQPRDLTNMILGLGPDRLSRAFDTVKSADAFDVLKILDFDVVVRSTAGLGLSEWPATLDRSSGRLDELTGSFGIIVRVENPNIPNPTEQRPPLNNGTFVEVTLKITDFEPAILLPRSAIKTNTDFGQYVYVMDSENRLRRRSVDVGASVNDQVVISDGLAPGESVILSDPQPAIEGLLVVPVSNQVDGEGA